jgi:hypothetical protein
MTTATPPRQAPIQRIPPLAPAPEWERHKLFQEPLYTGIASVLDDSDSQADEDWQPVA